jgi:hypothetical protein
VEDGGRREYRFRRGEGTGRSRNGLGSGRRCLEVRQLRRGRISFIGVRRKEEKKKRTRLFETSTLPPMSLAGLRLFGDALVVDVGRGRGSVAGTGAGLATAASAARGVRVGFGGRGREGDGARALSREGAEEV